MKVKSHPVLCIFLMFVIYCILAVVCVRVNQQQPLMMTTVLDCLCAIIFGLYYWRFGYSPNIEQPYEKSFNTFSMGAGITIVLWLFVSLIAGWMYRVIGDVSFDTYTVIESSSVLWSLVLGVVVAPIMEELLFRGILYGNLRKMSRIPSMVALLISSVVFALFHGTIVHIPTGIIMGIWFALVYEATKSLWVGMLVHGFYNLLALGGSLIAVPSWMGSTSVVILMLIASFVFEACFAIRLYYNKWPWTIKALQ